MPIMITKTAIAITAAATALSSMVGGGIAGDIDQTYLMAVDYADSKIEVVINEAVSKDLDKIHGLKYRGETDL